MSVQFSSFRMAFMDQWVDVQEVSNNNFSMDAARKMMSSRFDVVKEAGKDVFQSHVSAHRDSMCKV